MTEREAARGRHPSQSWAPDHDRLRRALAADLDARGHPWPLFAATILGVRGRLGLDEASFASAIGLSEQGLRAIEAGEAGPEALRPPWMLST
ncbi:MAG: hypothetical protein ACR2H3_16235 [Acidimicrobiales bacterium]